MADDLAGLAAALSGGYTIERELGRGGMATVYLARDLKHDRPVALKVLRPELAAILGAERFLREIQIAARLDHPHILTLIDSGAAKGFLYYVMPYVTGESLRVRLEREGQLPVDEALRITRAVASALDYAHQQGIIHRDIKPENILLHQGEPVVADFGIALAVRTAGQDRLTETGLSLGTPAYMSPEQASAEARLDARTDIYSLGCVLYEILAGEPPYTGPTAQAIIAKRLSEPLPHLSTVRAVPAALEQAITRALAKAPADRHATAAAFAEALTASAVTQAPALRSRVAVAAGLLMVFAVFAALWWRPAAGEEHPRVAVIPFETSGVAQDEYLVDAIGDAIHGRLADIAGLMVIARSSTSRYRGTTKSLAEVGRELGAEYLLTGTVRRLTRAGDSSRVRLMLELVHAPDGTALWQQAYDKAPDDVFSVEADVAERSALAIEDALGHTGASRDLFAATPERSVSTNLEAYNLHFRGRSELNKLTAAGDSLAIEYLTRAIAADSSYAPAWAGLARAYTSLFLEAGQRDLNPQSRAAARRALDLDAGSAEAHHAMGLVQHYFDWDPRAAEASYRRAIDLSPNFAPAYFTYAFLLSAMGRIDEAVEIGKRGRALDPVAEYSLGAVCVPLMFGRRFDEVIGEARAFLTVDSLNWIPYGEMGWAQVLKGEYAEGIRNLRQSRSLTPRTSGLGWFSALGAAYARAGMQAEARSVLDTLSRLAKTSYIAPGRFAAVYAALGESDSAFAWLEQAYALRTEAMLYLNVSPFWDVLRPDPRFRALVNKVGLPR